MLRLYEISTLESWTNYMHAAMDTVGIDMAMQPNANAAVAMYFHAFVVIGTFFVLNMFISEVVDCFRTTKVVFLIEEFCDREIDYEVQDLEELGKESAFMTPSQKQWRSALSYALRVGLRKRVAPPPPGLRLRVYRLVNTSRFETLVAALIIGSIVTQLLWFYDAPERWTGGLSAANAFFVVVFALEAGVKIVAFGPRAYFTDYWHLFDFTVAGLSVLALGLDALGGTVGRIKAVRAFRVIRVFRLFTRFESLKVLLNTFVLCLPALLNVGAVLVCALFVFAVLGVAMFGRVKLRSDLNEYANFRTVATAMVTLFRFATGENWNAVMHDLMVTEDCTPGVDCGSVYAPMYFISFVTLSQSILFQLLLSVVLESYAHNSSQSSLQISTRHINDFVRVWERMDRDATEFLHIDSQLPAFLRRLGPPLGLPRTSTNVEVVKRICALDMPVFAGSRVHFYEVLRACVDLVYRDSGAFLPIKVRRQIHREGLRAFGKLHGPSAQRAGAGEAAVSASLYYAAKVVQRRWREVMARRRENPNYVARVAGRKASLGAAARSVGTALAAVRREAPASRLERLERPPPAEARSTTWTTPPASPSPSAPPRRPRAPAPPPADSGGAAQERSGAAGLEAGGAPGLVQTLEKGEWEREGGGGGRRRAGFKEEEPRAAGPADAAGPAAPGAPRRRARGGGGGARGEGRRRAVDARLVSTDSRTSVDSSASALQRRIAAELPGRPPVRPPRPLAPRPSAPTSAQVQGGGQGAGRAQQARQAQQAEWARQQAAQRQQLAVQQALLLQQMMAAGPAPAPAVSMLGYPAPVPAAYAPAGYAYGGLAVPYPALLPGHSPAPRISPVPSPAFAAFEYPAVGAPGFETPRPAEPARR
eukprot:tig00000789_g4149.t1